MANLRLLSVIIALSLSFDALAAIGPTGNLTISNGNVNPDGYSRSAVLIGGSTPGPLVQGNMGDNFQLNVINQLSDTSMVTYTTVHWHGINQLDSNWADGAALVTQCPIITGDSFLYNFNVPNQAGTYWYHSHVGNQYCDGLRGPLVIYDPNDPHKSSYDVDNETTIITLTDWYHAPAATLSPPFTPDSVLINGLGRANDSSNASLAVITVTKGLRYRFRLIQMACDANFVFSIDSHDMTIIETDGENTAPLTVDSMQVYAAQRYSFILNASQPVDNYWIRAVPDASIPTGFAILRYEGAPNEDPTTQQVASSNPLSESNLHPFSDPAPPPFDPSQDMALNLEFTVNTTTSEFFVNGVRYVSPSTPILMQILNGTSPYDLLPKGSIYPIQRNQTVQVSMPGGLLNISHPMHLHGHTFSVIRSAGSDAPNDQNPVRRDTVNIGSSSDNVTIRFTADNPGPWFLHCHIDFHLVEGFAIVFAEDTGDVASTENIPTAWNQLCPAYDQQAAQVAAHKRAHNSRMIRHRRSIEY
ncbi:hypothetical protein AcW1_006623 [Taiwanofungus camphoratus]|nr:hypothetical protein AcW2_005384 [Antrodia cinnamomea]KAI0954852.1 hypothetical protein AcW1_006623 [Antrodia cinnamomea]